MVVAMRPPDSRSRPVDKGGSEVKRLAAGSTLPSVTLRREARNLRRQARDLERRARQAGVNLSLTPKVETAAWAQMFPRLLRAWVRRAQREGDLNALALLARHRDDVDAHMVDMVAALTGEPWCYSWSQIGDALGITKQAAQQRFHKASTARRPGGQPGDLR
jgi:hypothetical protein